jgi:hypothetical protein
MDKIPDSSNKQPLALEYEYSSGNSNELPCRKQRGIKNKNIERPKERGIKPLPASGGIKPAQDHLNPMAVYPTQW